MIGSRMRPLPPAELPGLVSSESTGEIVGRDERIQVWRGFFGGHGRRGAIRPVRLPLSARTGQPPGWCLFDTTGLPAGEVAAAMPLLADRTRRAGTMLLLAGLSGGLTGGRDTGEEGFAAGHELPDVSAVRTEHAQHWVLALDRFWSPRVATIAERLRPERVSLLLPFPSVDPRESDVLLTRAVRSIRSVGIEPSHCYVSAFTPLRSWRVVGDLVAAHERAYGRRRRRQFVLSPPAADARMVGLIAAAHSLRLPMLLPRAGTEPAARRGAADDPTMPWLCAWDLA